MASVSRLGLTALAALLAAAGCTISDPVRNLANQGGNAGPPAGGTQIALREPVWEKPLPPPGPIRVGRR